jgi:hypothetical protein
MELRPQYSIPTAQTELESKQFTATLYSGKGSGLVQYLKQFTRYNHISQDRYAPG